MTSTHLISGDSAFDRLAQEWDELVDGSMTDTPFQSLAYQRAWWRHLQPPDSNLYTITVWDERNHLSAIACFYVLNGVLHFNGCVEETDYLDLIAPVEKAKEAWEAVLDCLHSPGFPDWNALDLCNVPAASPTRSILPEMAKTRASSFYEDVHEVCPVIELPATFDEYLDSLPRKQRHEIRRKLRRAEGAGAEVRTVGPDDDVEEEVGEFLELLQKSTLEKRDWLNDGRRAVFLETAAAAHERGNLQLMFFEVANRRAAALFNFEYKNRIWVYNSGLDPSAFRNLSTGVVITAKAIENAIARGIATFDFLRGSETYKYRFGAEDTFIYRLRWVRDARQGEMEQSTVQSS